MPSSQAPRALKRRYGHAAVAARDVVYERSGGWWAVSTPRYPGAFSQGRTRQAAYGNLLDAIAELERAK